MRIITFYTDEYYKQFAHNLVHSGKEFGYEINNYDLTPATSLLWEGGILAKVKLIQRLYNKFKAEPLLYIDADCLIKKPLDHLFKKMEKYHFCLRDRFGHPDYPDRFNLGVMGIGVKLSKFIDEWAIITKLKFGHSTSVDQKPFEHVFNQKKYTLWNLGSDYNCMPNDTDEAKANACIWHLKASKQNNTARAWRKSVHKNKE